MVPVIRRATLDDEHRLAEIDRETWSGSVTPAARWPQDRPFFAAGDDPGDVLVAEVDGDGVRGGAVVGYAKLGAPTPLASNRHVVEIRGLAVLPAYQRRGIGAQLIGAATKASAAAGVRRLTLRVLATNPDAQRLYASLGFEVEGVLRGEFLIDGQYVDDVLMAKLVG